MKINNENKPILNSNNCKIDTKVNPVFNQHVQQ